MRVPRRTFATRLVALLSLLVTGCTSTVQTTSGADFLAARPEWASQFAARAPGAGAPARSVAGRAPSDVDRAVFEAANVEPLLRFPARIGLARLQHGTLTGVPPEEGDAWLELVRARGSAYGELVPVSPLLAQLAPGRPAPEGRRSPVDTIRIAAARQHLDAVLIYEVGGTARDSATPLSVADLTIIGAFLIPSRSLEGSATAAAMLVDVRNGYPYGNAFTAAQRSGFSVNAGSGARSTELRRAAEAEAVRKLTVEVGTMLDRLRASLPAAPARAEGGRPMVRS